MTPDNKGRGHIESTVTLERVHPGKSLSLICGSLTWLRDHEAAGHEQPVNTSDDVEPAWVAESVRKERLRHVLEERRLFQARLNKVQDREKRERQRYENGQAHPKRLRTDGDTIREDNGNGEEDFVLEDYDSDTEEDKKSQGAGETSEIRYSVNSVELMKKLGMVQTHGDDEDVSPYTGQTKIFFCSRTHSQLTQFASELRRVKIPPLDLGEVMTKDTSTDDLADDVRYLSLGSRKNLCINPKVTKLGNTTAINEKCLDLQTPGTSSDRKCQFLPTKESEVLVNDFRDYAMAKVRDIEDLGALGKKIGICPYYASRAVIPSSEIIALPYPLLLQKSAREALGISLKDHVVIIDEAHNLMDAVANIYSVSVTLVQLQQSRAQLGMYLQKFRNRLKGKNRVYVAQIIRLLDSLITYLANKAGGPGVAEGTAALSELMAGRGVDQINMFKLDRYIRESKLARKVDGYTSSIEDSTKPSTSRKTSTPFLMLVQSFLQVLTNPTQEGRFFYSCNETEKVALKYMLLDPVHYFRDVVQDARAVILAGGTMSPMDDYMNHLFPYVPSSQIRILSCGHVIPSENLAVYPVSCGPTGVDLDFTYSKRALPSLIDELGRTLLALAKTIPDGLVVFFPSYAYLEVVIARLKRTGQDGQNTTASNASMWTLLARRKPIFLESKHNGNQGADMLDELPMSAGSTANLLRSADQTEDVLKAYTASIINGKAGFLLSVIGGKLSEGINFSDRLGRGVVVVGLPFPNIQSAEWKAKMAYIEAQASSAIPPSSLASVAGKPGGDKTIQGKRAAREFYENACMRAVNQSVGRAIRHKGDWAAIILLDGRYKSERIWAKLPAWIRASADGNCESTGGGESTPKSFTTQIMGSQNQFAKVVTGLESFFRGKLGLE
ncbi:ATP-dependent DNA helicase chl1 [Agyrium rufum]|nr:ATP-dependent DNA helicase chl1 [Agyrium rufum]